MAKIEKSKANWLTIDEASLDAGPAALLARYRELYKTMKAAREAFEDSLQGMAPAGQRIIISYNFGKLSMAVVEAEDKPAKAVGTISFSQLIKRA